ncbi:hypothetical protein TWF281_010603 [Arthrobotrys megalospora]
MSRRLSTRQQNNVKKATTTEVASSDVDEKSASPVNFIGVKQYYTQEQRLKSFTSPPARKRQSNAKKGSKASKWSWPANHPSAELMARAGFYFKPTQGEEDNAACFLCQKNMSFWEPEDDPAEQHGRHGTTCGWALTMCSDLVVDGQMATEPLGEEMCRARRMTFDQWWPHEGKKEWKPTVEKVVMAGFIFRPRGEGDDTVYCPYCSLSIDAWEQNDDPREAHKSLGSGDCVFLRHTANASVPTANENEDNVVQPSDAGEVEEQSSSKRRVSRARKPPTTTQRKKTTPRGQPDPEEKQNPALKNGGAEDDGGESKKPARGKKRGSAAMEEGGKKLLFPNVGENTANIVDAQQPPIGGHETQKPRPTKRRVTRASMANQPSTLNLIVNAPDHLTHGDGEDVGSMSIHNTPVKPKPKEKKKATRPSTSSKPTKGTKKASSKVLVNAPRPSDEEIDRELEREIMEGFRDPDDDEKQKEDVSAIAPNHESSDSEGSNEPTEPEATQPPLKKTTRRLTRTKPASRRSPTPDSTGPIDDQEHQPKPRRKKLTRTKPKNTVPTDTQSAVGDVTNLEDPNEIESTTGTPPTPQAVCDNPIATCVVESNDEPALGHPVQTATPQQVEFAPLGSEPEPEEQAPVPTPTADPPSTDAAIETALLVKKVDDPRQENSQDPQKTPSAQLVVARSTSISPTKDKDMKRKSDVVTDDGQDRRTSKKRKTVKAVKAAKPRASPKKKGSVVPIPSETPQRPRQADQAGAVAPKNSIGNNAEGVQSSVLPTLEYVSATAPKDDVELPSTHDDSVTEEQETILDDFGDNPLLGEEDARLAIIKGSTSEDNTIDVILNGYARPREAALQKTGQAETAPTSEADKTRSSPCVPSDTGSQDSISNTQFSMPASQMTVATSFHGSIKGVSFIRTAEEPAIVEQHVSPTEDVREQSIVVSPKQSRTPLSVLSKSHNGALALMTPRNRAEDVSFAPVQSQKPWKSTDVEVYIDGLKENQEIEPRVKGLSESERGMTVAEWIMDVSTRAEKQLIQKGELLVRFFEDEAERAVSAIEAIETE